MNIMNGGLGNAVDGLRQQNLLDGNRLQEENTQCRLTECPDDLKEQLVNNADSVSIKGQNLSESAFKLAEQMSDEEIQNALDNINSGYSPKVHNYLDPQRVAFLTGM